MNSNDFTARYFSVWTIIMIVLEVECCLYVSLVVLGMITYTSVVPKAGAMVFSVCVIGTVFLLIYAE